LKVATSRFGELEINESDVITLSQGLIGFPELNRFVILEHDKESPFKWLQSLDEMTVAFVIMSPLAFHPSYIVDVTEDEIQELDLKSPEDAVICVLVTIPNDPKKMSANLKAPLVFNLENKLGKQVILKDSEFQTKHYIIDEMKKHAVTRNMADESLSLKLEDTLSQQASQLKNMVNEEKHHS
jgi:flagellar assembly factor FliW